jgi:hypothetical protein
VHLKRSVQLTDCLIAGPEDDQSDDRADAAGRLRKPMENAHMRTSATLSASTWRRARTRGLLKKNSSRGAAAM